MSGPRVAPVSSKAGNHTDDRCAGAERAHEGAVDAAAALVGHVGEQGDDADRQYEREGRVGQGGAALQGRSSSCRMTGSGSHSRRRGRGNGTEIAEAKILFDARDPL